jgi:C4-dicarboxylate-specific signal transduction histidine kinase
VVVLDVIMENDDSGLEVVEVVRSKLCNHRVRIVLRTGQAGFLHELDVMQKYDVNGYLPKHDLTRERLLSALMASLRDFDYIDHIESLKEKVAATGRRAALGDLAAGVVHDLNNPLTIAILHQQRALQMLHAQDPIQMQRSLHKIGEACERIQRLSLHLLNFARSRVEEMEILNLRQIVENSLQLTDTRLGSLGIDVDNRQVSDEVFVRVRRHEMERVLVNLINNSCDALELVVDRKLIFRCDSHAAGVVLSLKDTGAGIASEDMHSIFESFYTTKSYENGTGLGLSVSRGIMRDHGGDLTLHRSDVGWGTEFHLFFPDDFEQIEVESNHRE